jgi:hypothetical protein
MQVQVASSQHNHLLMIFDGRNLHHVSTTCVQSQKLKTHGPMGCPWSTQVPVENPSRKPRFKQVTASSVAGPHKPAWKNLSGSRKCVSAMNNIDYVGQCTSMDSSFLATVGVIKETAIHCYFRSISKSFRNHFGLAKLMILARPILRCQGASEHHCDAKDALQSWWQRQHHG